MLQAESWLCPSGSPVCRLQWPHVLEGSTCLGGQIVCPCSPVGLRHTCAPGLGHTLAFLILEEVVVAAISSIQFPHRPPSAPVPPQQETDSSHHRFAKRRLEFLRRESWKLGGTRNTPQIAKKFWGAWISTIRRPVLIGLHCVGFPSLHWALALAWDLQKTRCPLG